MTDQEGTGTGSKRRKRKNRKRGGRRKTRQDSETESPCDSDQDCIQAGIDDSGDGSHTSPPPCLDPPGQIHWCDPSCQVGYYIAPPAEPRSDGYWPFFGYNLSGGIGGIWPHAYNDCYAWTGDNESRRRPRSRLRQPQVYCPGMYDDGPVRKHYTAKLLEEADDDGQTASSSTSSSGNPVLRPDAPDFVPQSQDPALNYDWPNQRYTADNPFGL